LQQGWQPLNGNQNQAAIAFDVRGNQICGYREYLGVVFQLGTR
jgi:hypothetical protein